MWPTKVVSSAYITKSNFVLVMVMSFTYIKKSNVPIIEPWGTSVVIRDMLYFILSIATCCELYFLFRSD